MESKIPQLQQLATPPQPIAYRFPPAAPGPPPGVRSSRDDDLENFPYSSYPDSGHSSPRSRDIDDTQSWDEPLPGGSPNYKVKLMCSFGGKIHPRPMDNQLTYVGGDTKILTVERTVKFSNFAARLASILGEDSAAAAGISFKYQLPGEDLDALISVTNDEDLEHMMMEYDRCRSASRPTRLRLFLFPPNSGQNIIPPPPPQQHHHQQQQQVEPIVEPPPPGGELSKPDQQWFVEALNSAPAQISTRPAEVPGPDYFYGMDKMAPVATAPPQPPPEVRMKEELQRGQDVGIQGVHPAEIHRQLQEFQRMQINQEAAAAAAFHQKKQEENLSRSLPVGSGYLSRDVPTATRGTGPAVNAGEYYMQKIQEKPAPPPPPPAPHHMPATYWAPPTPDRSFHGSDQPVYFVPSSPSIYPQNARQVSNTQGYYAKLQAGFVSDPYREAGVYGLGSAGKVSGYPDQQGMVRPTMGVQEMPPFSHVGYDSVGRQVYLATQGAPGVSNYQAGANQDPRTANKQN